MLALISTYFVCKNLWKNVQKLKFVYIFKIFYFYDQISVMQIMAMTNDTDNRLDSIEKRLDSIETTLEKVVQNFNKLYVAVVGNETFDQEGILHRLKRVEKEVGHWTKIRLKLMGVFIGGGVAWTVLWELGKKFLIK